VVVVENIHRRLADGGDRDAIEKATAELVQPIVGSTLTTVVVFAPLGLLSGVVGDFFKALSITLSAAVLISLVLALYLIPLLASAAYRKPSDDRAHDDRRGPLDRWYVSTLPALLHRPMVALLIGLVLAGAAVVAYLPVGTGFLLLPTKEDSSSTTSRLQAWPSRRRTSG
jgi:multidrug efflux pump subunit AcrB